MTASEVSRGTATPVSESVGRPRGVEGTGKVAAQGLAPPAVAPVADLSAKVVLVGDAGVGKTSLVRRYVHGDFIAEYVATLGVVLSKRAVEVVLDDRAIRVSMVLWDTMGERTLAPTLRDSYLQDARGVLVVCDGTSPDTVGSVRGWLDAARQVAEPAALAVLANKSDLGSDPRATAGVLAGSLAASAPPYRTSARTGENVRAALEALACRIAARALAAEEGPFDAVSMGIVIDASVRPRTLSELCASVRRPEAGVLARAESLVRRGYLRVTSMGIGPDGRAAPTYTATGKRFPPP